MVDAAREIRPADIPIVVLCGGLGTRLKEETEYRPKPMVPIGEQPILWHIMRLYARAGFRKFILCLGFKGNVIKSYFLDYASMRSDLTVRLQTNEVSVHSIDHDEDWEVTLAETGDSAMTGARVARAGAKYLAGYDHFGVTYGDGLTSADLSAELAFHVSHGKTGTVLGVNPPSRFGELKVLDDDVVQFDEKPRFNDVWINGGFFFFKSDFLERLSAEDDCVLERAPLRRLADEGELRIYKHNGFWACMDTQRDREYLEELWKSQEAPWLREGERETH